MLTGLRDAEPYLDLEASSIDCNIVLRLDRHCLEVLRRNAGWSLARCTFRAGTRDKFLVDTFPAPTARYYTQTVSTHH
jgi:hypothetical protein